MARLDLIGAVNNVRTMLATCSSWQSICGVSSSTDASKRIYRGGIEDDGTESLCPMILLRIDPLQTDFTGDTSRGKLTVECRIELAIPEDKSDSYEAQYVWVWEKLSAILADINASVNGSGGLMMRSLNMPLEPGPIDPNDNHGKLEWAMVLGIVIEML